MLDLRELNEAIGNARQSTLHARTFLHLQACTTFLNELLELRKSLGSRKN